MCATPTIPVNLYIVPLLYCALTGESHLQQNSENKPLQTRNAKKKNPLKLFASPKISSRGLVLGNCPQIQSKTKKNGKFPSNNKASPIIFETQISFHR